MDEPRKLPGTVEFAGYTCNAYLTRYSHGGAQAVFLTDTRDGGPVATATVNVPGVGENLPEGHALLKDYAENEGMLAALQAAGLVADTGRRVPTGYVQVPVVRLLFPHYGGG